jgi:hypothetical protein
MFLIAFLSSYVPAPGSQTFRIITVLYLSSVLNRKLFLRLLFVTTDGRPLWGPSMLLFNGYRCSFLVVNWPGREGGNLSLIVPRLRMSGAVPLFSVLDRDNFCPYRRRVCTWKYGPNQHYHHHILYVQYLHVYTWNKPSIQAIQCCSYSVVTVRCAYNAICNVILYFYISTFLSMCAVPNMAVFCSSSFSCFPVMLLRYFLNYIQMDPVALIIIHCTCAVFLL